MSTTISKAYTHLVEYCETDAMKIVHHAEYIKWMEYARHHFLLHHGFDWAKMEKEYGIMMPILSVSMDYRNMTTFGETVEISVELKKYNGIYMVFSYEIREQLTGQIKAIGTTKSGFVNASYKPVMLQEACPEYYQLLLL